MTPPDGASLSRKVVKAACPHDCPDTCAMEVTVENGVAVEVRGGDMPFTGGTLCTKVAKYLDRTYSKDRVLYPLRRVGPKGPGQGRLERISWDAALDEIAGRFKAIAAEDPQQILPCGCCLIQQRLACDELIIDNVALTPDASGPWFQVIPRLLLWVVTLRRAIDFLRLHR